MQHDLSELIKSQIAIINKLTQIFNYGKQQIVKKILNFCKE